MIAILPRVVCAVVALGIASWCAAQSVPLNNPDFEIPSAEQDRTGKRFAADWAAIQHAGPPSYEFAIDREVFKTGKQSIRIKRTKEQWFGAAIQSHSAMPWLGKTLEFKGWLRLDGVDGEGAAGYIRVDEGPNILIMDDRQARSKGTHDWKPFRVVFEIPPDATQFEIGITLLGAGTLWADGLSVNVTRDAAPATGKPKKE